MSRLKNQNCNIEIMWLVALSFFNEMLNKDINNLVFSSTAAIFGNPVAFVAEGLKARLDLGRKSVFSKLEGIIKGARKWHSR